MPAVLTDRKQSWLHKNPDHSPTQVQLYTSDIEIPHDNVYGRHDNVYGRHDNVYGCHDNVYGRHDNVYGRHDNVS